MFGMAQLATDRDFTSASERFEPYATAIAAFTASGIDLSKLSAKPGALSAAKLATASEGAYSASADLQGRTEGSGLAGIDAEKFLKTARELRRSIVASQLKDGGWKDNYGSDKVNGDPQITAKIVLELLQTNNLEGARRADEIERATAFLNTALKNPLYLSHVPEICVALLRANPDDARRSEIAKMLRNQVANRSKLSTDEKVSLATALGLIGDRTDAELLLRNVADYAVYDAARRTVRWSANTYGRYGDPDADLSARVLLSLLTVKPQTRLIAGMPAGASYLDIAEMTAKWLIESCSAFGWEPSSDTYAAEAALRC